METGTPSDITGTVLYPKCSKHLRIFETILCVVCLGLAFYIWSKGNTSLAVILILFATAFDFLALTLVDLIASFIRRQYSAPVWTGIAFLAAFTFFLSFGFMVLQSFLPYILIGVVFGVTGIVFLIDGIINIMSLFQTQFPKKVHPVSEEKEARDEVTQVDEDLKIIEEIPFELRKVAPKLEAAPKEVKKVSPRAAIPITSYGRTFSVGGSDPPHLPTPDTLTGSLFQTKFPKKVHPVSEEKEARDEITQVDEDLKIIEEIPFELRKVAPKLEAAPKEVKKVSPRAAIPITSYGGTFSVGGSDPTHLPTPDTLTGSLFQTQFPKKVHPVSEEKEARDEVTQVDEDLKIIEEIPFELRKVAPKLEAAPKEVKNASPRASIPITSYGGTFPVGGSDAPPLPTPDTLTGLEPTRPSRLYVPRRYTQDNTSETHSISTETDSPRLFSINENGNMYSSIRGDTVNSHDPDGYVQSFSSDPTYKQQNATNKKQNQELPSATYHQKSEELSIPIYNRQNEVQPPVRAEAIQVQPLTQEHVPYHKNTQEPLKSSPDEAAGSPQPTSFIPPRASTDARYPRQMLPGSTQMCQCCATRAAPQARDQVAQFVTHHYNQTPCIWGYTHYQASAVVKQYPENTVQQQQRMIKDQLEQTRRSNIYRGCFCNDEPTTESKVPYMHLVRDSPIVEDARNSDLSTDRKFMTTRTSEEEGTNSSIFISSSNLHELASNSKKNWSSATARRRASDDVRTKETIVTSDVISSSNSPQQRIKPKSQHKRSSLRRESAEYTQPENLQPYTANDFNSIEDDVTSHETASIPKNEANFTPKDISGISPLGVDMEKSSSSLDSANESDGSCFVTEETLGSGFSQKDPQSKRKTSRDLTNKERANNNVYSDPLPSSGVDRQLNDIREDERITEAQENLVASICPPPEPKIPDVCQVLPPQCMCCPNVVNSMRRPRYLRKFSDSSSRRLSKVDNTEIDDTKKISNHPVAIPRTLDRIREQRLTDDMHHGDSEERINHFPSFHDGFEEDVVANKQMFCRCTCICHPQSRLFEIPKETDNTTALSPKRYNAEQLNQRPYHPKDEFQMPENLFTKPDCMDSLENSIEAHPRRNKRKRKEAQDKYYYQSRRSPQFEPTMLKKIPLRCSMKYLAECDDYSNRREKPIREHLEEFSSCPFKWTVEAKLKKEPNEDENTSISKMGPLKRSYPDQRK